MADILRAWAADPAAVLTTADVAVACNLSIDDAALALTSAVTLCQVVAGGELGQVTWRLDRLGDAAQAQRRLAGLLAEDGITTIDDLEAATGGARSRIMAAMSSLCRRRAATRIEGERSWTRGERWQAVIRAWASADAAAAQAAADDGRDWQAEAIALAAGIRHPLERAAATLGVHPDRYRPSELVWRANRVIRAYGGLEIRYPGVHPVMSIADLTADARAAQAQRDRRRGGRA